MAAGDEGQLAHQQPIEQQPEAVNVRSMIDWQAPNLFRAHVAGSAQGRAGKGGRVAVVADSPGNRQAGEPRPDYRDAVHSAPIVSINAPRTINVTMRRVLR